VTLRNERERCGEPIADVVARYAPLQGVEVDADLALRAIDEIPLLAVAASCARGETRIRGIADLRTKESDRVAAVRELLAAAGIESDADATSMTVRGGHPRGDGALVRAHGDHRIAMAAAMLACAGGPLELDDAESIDVSFPEFLPILARTRAA
jgi:5-enolpyruvylshikimate-3-phosphate synthase